MNRWTYGIIALLLVPVQTTWLNGIELHSVKPDLVLLLVYFTGFYAGEMSGLRAGLGMGLGTDLVSGGPFGLHIATLAMMGLVSGLLGRFFLNTTATLTMGMVFMLSILDGILVFFFHQWVLGGIQFADVFRWTLLPEALYNTATAGIVFWAGLGRLNIKKQGAGTASLSIPIS
ncbi:MAG: rod shape-determining protein MreD [Nitrospirae bacterium]|nr:rod shape-determining protein MreD [Nitrospirota bacterium]